MLISKKNLIESLPITKFFEKPKQSLISNEVTDFYNKKIPKANSNHTCLAVISLDFALLKDENFYPAVYLKKCKYIEKKVVRHIIDDL